MLRKHSAFLIVTGCMSMAEYLYFLFAFPVENWHFHKRAVSRDKPYAQHLRDTYIQRFPDTWKSKVYQRVNRELDAQYAKETFRVLQQQVII